MEEDTDCVSPWRVPKPRRPIDESESFPSQSPPYVPIPTGSQPKRLQVGIAYVPPTDRVMTDPASDQDGISPWRAAKPRRPIHDDQDSPPTRLFASPPPPASGGKKCSPPSSSHKESTRMECVASPENTNNNSMGNILSPRAGISEINYSPGPSPRLSAVSKLSLRRKSTNKSESLIHSHTVGGGLTDSDGESREEDDDQPSGRCTYVGSSYLSTTNVDKVDGIKHHTFNWLALVVVVAMIAAGAGVQIFRETRPKYTLYAEPEPLTEQQWNKSRAVFINNKGKMKKLLPLQPKKTWLTISAAAKRTLQSQPDYPAVILLLARTPAAATANCMASLLVDAAEESLQRTVQSGERRTARTIVPSQLPIDDDEQAGKLLWNGMDSSLKTRGSVAVFNVERIRPQVALAFHGFADSVNAPYKQSFLVMTLIDHRPWSDCTEASEAVTVKECLKMSYNLDSRAEDLLVSAWGEELGPDKVYPLVSRLTVNVVEVRPEEMEMKHGVMENCRLF